MNTTQEAPQAHKNQLRSRNIRKIGGGIAIVAAGIAGINVLSPHIGEDDSAQSTVAYICEGSQKIPVQTGDTLDALVHEKVLPEGATMADAHHVGDYIGLGMFDEQLENDDPADDFFEIPVHPVDTYFAQPLRAGTEIELPEICSRVQ